MSKPKKTNYKAILIALLVCVAAAVIFLTGLWSKDAAQMGAAENPEPDEIAVPLDLSVWVVDRDWESGLNEMHSIAGLPDSLQAFGASFDTGDKLFLADDAKKMVAAMDVVREDAPGLPVYLTIANDRMDGSGEWTEGDGALLERLVRTTGTRTKHINDIINLAQENGFDGVEVDYKNISGDDFGGFAAFCTTLFERLDELDMKLRVVLEPDMDFEAAALPTGPEYVVTTYGLHGAGTEAGPRTDDAFIRSLAGAMETLPGEKRMAFATGGFDWDANGAVCELTESEAYELSLASGDVKRDEASGMLYFEYTAGDGSTHTVWYADAETLAGWFDLSRSLGYGDAALWRMGGNRPETLEMIRNLKGVGLN